MRKTVKSGFTIVELVIVIAVIAILAAVLIPTFSGIIEKGHHSSALSEAKSAATQIAGTLGNGSVPDNTVFAVSKNGKAYYWLYNDGALTEVNAEDIVFSETVDILISSSLSQSESEALLKSTFGESELTVSADLTSKTVKFGSESKSLYSASDLGSSVSVLFFEKTGLTEEGADFIRVDEDGNPDEDDDDSNDEANYIRVDSNGNPDENGDYIRFGSYPQTKVTDNTLITTLNAKTGTLPTGANSQSWTSYKYYQSESNVTDYMWYIDITESENQYRGVYFTSFRPNDPRNSSISSNSYQDENGYSTGTVYWFKFEPLTWAILNEEDDKALIICNSIIDSQQYDYDGSFSNNYSESTIRTWLNDEFLNTAFTAKQIEQSFLTTVDNSARSTNPSSNATQWNSGSNSYACANTQDKVFLLSEQEVTTSAYNFASYSTNDTARQKKYTDYAKAQGACKSSSFGYEANGYWWLRSPDYHFSYEQLAVGSNGLASTNCSVYLTSYGIVPALQITLN